MPLGLKKWAALLAAKPLPVMELSMRTLKAQMANSQLALVDYAKPILDDPGLAVQFLHQANQSRQSAHRELLTTLSNALSHLGRGQLDQLVTQVQTLDRLGLPDRNVAGYRAAVAAACHGAYLALDWAQQRNIHQPEEMQLAALLQFIAELALWCHGGQVMPEIENRCYAQGLDYDLTAEQVLGCSIRALGAALARAWVLPELVAQGLDVKAQDFTLASGVRLASRLARLVQHSWHDQAARLCLDDIARYKGHSLSEMEPQIHQNAVALSDHFMALGLPPPARLLPMLVDENYIDPKFITTQAQPLSRLTEQDTVIPPSVAIKTEQTTEPARIEVTPSAIPLSQHSPRPQRREKQAGVNLSTNKPSSVTVGDKTSDQSMAKPLPGIQADNDKLIKSAAKQNTSDISPALASKLASIKTMVKQQVHAGELIQVVVEAIELSGFERVVFAVKVPKKKILYGRFFAQANTDKAFKEFKISIAQPNLFSLLMNKSQCLWMNDDNRGKYWSRVPDGVKLMLQNDSFMAMSIFTHKHSVGLMYADRSDGQLTPNEYRRFQGLCRLLSDAMVEISHPQGG